MNTVGYFEILANEPARAIAFVCSMEVADFDATAELIAASGGVQAMQRANAELLAS